MTAEILANDKDGLQDSAITAIIVLLKMILWEIQNVIFEQYYSYVRMNKNEL